ncbi:MAG: DUF1116 domain-containing protein, partial [Thermoleophilia bacterium]
MSVSGPAAIADDLAVQGAAVMLLERRGNPGPTTIGRLVSAYADDDIRAANERVVQHLHTTRPVLTGVTPAGLLLENPPAERWVLVGGPSADWARLTDPQRRAAAATCVLEGWAGDPDAGMRLLAEGAVHMATAWSAGACAPLAAVIGPSTPCWTFRDDATTAVAAAPVLVGGAGAVWMGARHEDALRDERVCAEVLAPGLAGALQATGHIDVFGMVAEALWMGDDGHTRAGATSLLALRALLGALSERAPHAVRAAAALMPGEGIGLSLITGAARATLAGLPPAAGS